MPPQIRWFMRISLPVLVCLVEFCPGPHAVQAQIRPLTGRLLVSAPAISLSVPSGSPGTRTMLGASGFLPADSLSVSFDGVHIASCAADATGRLASCPLVIPAASAGPHSVVVTDSASNAASAPFTIVPVLILSAPAGPVGGRALVAARGFAAFAPISVLFDGAVVATCPADATGTRPSCAFTIPPVAAGVHSIQAMDSSGDVVAPVSFSVVPVISVAAGAGGASAALAGRGFAPLATVTVLFDGTAVVSCPADQAGTLASCAFTVPLSAAGLHSIRAVDSAGHAAITAYTVGPALSISPAVAAIGARAVVEGRGFAASRAVSVTFDGVLATSCATDLRGTLSGCAFVIPPVVPGAHRVAAIDSRGHAVSLPFTVT
jgi:hypothetical protein